jgi:phospholipid-binding lipoprotein MlaA
MYRIIGYVFASALLFGVLSPRLVLAEQDPYQGFNRKVFQFNEWTDSKILRPTAKAYDKWVPRPIRGGVGNVFDNVFTPATALNQLLQGKPKRSLSDTGRFLMNTTLGLAGLFDVASRVGIPKHEEDFGQTFAVWGAGGGHYLVLPFFGPSNIRDSFGLAVSSLINPLRFISPVEDRVAVTALYVVDLRADLIGVDELVTGDKYLFRRDTYLQRREFLIKDGVSDEDPFEDDGFDDFDDE